ncbi:hypothetical protein L6452_37720 [Arctium lappa]|uniref:Uncharacterized protein n=1 Tax=Arctium lappa TaxID=4217 RepID=A0ACB8Y3Q7_ARCLA|nr:hypothetical protein L6452_37720 [Arctium lappa]
MVEESVFDAGDKKDDGRDQEVEGIRKSTTSNEKESEKDGSESTPEQHSDRKLAVGDLPEVLLPVGGNEEPQSNKCYAAHVEVPRKDTTLDTTCRAGSDLGKQGNDNYLTSNNLEVVVRGKKQLLSGMEMEGKVREAIASSSVCIGGRRQRLVNFYAKTGLINNPRMIKLLIGTMI